VTVIRLLRVVAGERRWIVLAALAATVTLVAGVGLVATSSYLISRSALVTTTAGLGVAITSVRLFAVLRAVGRYVERYVGHLGTFRILTRLRAWFFRAVVPLGPARLGDIRKGDLVGRVVADVDTLQDFYLRVVVPPLAAVATTVVAAAVLAWFHPPVGLVLAVALLVAAVLVPLWSTRASDVPASEVVRARAERSAVVTEGASALGELLVLGAEHRWADAVGEADRATHRAERRLTGIGAATDASVTVLQSVAAVAVVAISVDLVAGGRLDGVYLAVLPLVALAAFEAVAPVAAAPPHLRRSRAAAARLFDLADEPPEVVDPPRPASLPDGFDLEVEELTFRYPGAEVDALAHLTASFPAGSRVAVVGPSGCGKSTLAALLLRFREYHHGTIRLGGIDLRDLRAADVRSRIAVVAQHDHLFDTSVRDNLLLAAPEADDDELWAALRTAELADVVEQLPAGLSERVGEGGNRLSGGERQRLMIARVLLTDAPVLVLDEATAHLDPVTEARVLANVWAAREGRTIVVVSHHADRLPGVDRVVRVEPRS
jgi:ATP-binding cassette, subfamily C, bacterial CydC